MRLTYSNTQLQRMQPSERQRVIAEKEEAAVAALRTTAKKLEEEKRNKQRKRRTPEELLELIHLDGLEDKIIRDPKDYNSKSYNQQKQMEGLIEHLFVKYPTPKFFYPYLAKATTLGVWEIPTDTIREWFITIAQGGSFKKAAKDYLNSKEAALFLQAPLNRGISANIWWTKMRNLGLGERDTESLLSRVFIHFRAAPENIKRGEDCILFFVRHREEMDNQTFQDVADFIRYRLVGEPGFGFLGRTVNSMVQLATRWHLELQKAKVGAYVNWDGMGLKPWVIEKLEDRWFEVVELTSNTELLKEGKKQRHCVYSYVTMCQSGRTAIFSLRSYHTEKVGPGVYVRGEETARSTIEVDVRDGRVSQFLGALNCKPHPLHSQALRLWCGEKGLSSGRF